MKNKYTKEQIELMREIGLNYDFDKPSDDNICDTEEIVGDELTMLCQSTDLRTPRILMCEEILHINYMISEEMDEKEFGDGQR